MAWRSFNYVQEFFIESWNCTKVAERGTVDQPDQVESTHNMQAWSLKSLDLKNIVWLKLDSLECWRWVTQSLEDWGRVPAGARAKAQRKRIAALLSEPATAPQVKPETLENLEESTDLIFLYTMASVVAMASRRGWWKSQGTKILALGEEGMRPQSLLLVEWLGFLPSLCCISFR